MLTLYNGTTRVCSIKVRIGLAEIGLPYKSVVLDLQAGDQHAPEYLQLNPEGFVPTLIDDWLVLVESSLILEYLDRVHNAGRLMPAGRTADAAARHWLLRCLAIHDAINTLTFSTVNREKVLSARTPEQREAMLSRMPGPARRMKRRDLYEHGLSSGHVDQAIITLAGTFRDMSGALDSAAWVSGADFGIADIALVSYIDRLERLGFEGLWSETGDAVSR
jgi:glutathione S-transferase